MEIVAASSGSAGTGCPRHRAALAAFSSYALTEPDLDDLPADVRQQMRFHPVSSIDEVLAAALEDADVAKVA